MSESTQFSAPVMPEQPRRHRRGHRASYRRARILLLVLFVVFNAVNIVVFLGVPLHLRRYLMALMVSDALWSTFLFAAIWMRHKWARYFMISLQAVSLIIEVLIVPEFFQPAAQLTYPHLRMLLLALVITYGAVTTILITGHNIKRLTSRAYE